MRNLTAELHQIGAAMTRALDDADERVTETFVSEADALESLLRDGASASSSHEHESHAAPDHMNMDLPAWREQAGLDPTEDSPLEHPLPPAPESAGDIFVHSSDSESTLIRSPTRARTADRLTSLAATIRLVHPSGHLPNAPLKPGESGSIRGKISEK